MRHEIIGAWLTSPRRCPASSLVSRCYLQDGRVLLQDTEGDPLDILTQLPVGLLLGM